MLHVAHCTTVFHFLICCHNTKTRLFSYIFQYVQDSEHFHVAKLSSLTTDSYIKKIKN